MWGLLGRHQAVLPGELEQGQVGREELGCPEPRQLLVRPARRVMIRCGCVTGLQCFPAPLTQPAVGIREIPGILAT